MCSACRMASATMVSVGLAAAPVVNTDPSEMNDVADLHPEIVKKLSPLLDQAHEANARYPLFPREQNR